MVSYPGAGLHEGESGVEHGFSITPAHLPCQQKGLNPSSDPAILSPLPVVSSYQGDGAERKLLQRRENETRLEKNQRTKSCVQVRKEEGEKKRAERERG